MGDMVFGTEPHQVSNMIKGAFTIPHPSNIRALKRLGHDKSQDQNAVGLLYHWWNPNVLHPYHVFRHLKEKFGIEKTQLFSYGRAEHQPFDRRIKQLKS